MPGSPVVQRQSSQDRQNRKEAGNSPLTKVQIAGAAQSAAPSRFVSPGKSVGPGNGFSTPAQDSNGYKVPGLPASALNGGARTNGHNGSAHASTSVATLQNDVDLERAVRNMPIFEPQSWRKWQKSRRKDEESASVLPSVEELKAQLLSEQDELVPLNAISGRVVHYAWQLFANQVEINPSLSTVKRREKIFQDAFEARKQLIKLLVLVRWSSVAPELLLARNLIALINDQITQIDVAVTSLADTKGILSSARLRNYDLRTAIETLSSPLPQRVAPSMRELIHFEEPYSDSEAIALVNELDDVLRLRLASDEILPLAMLSYDVSDGRVCFVANDLFEADLTLSGNTNEDRWWLLRVKFDFSITGVGADRFQRQLRGQQRLNLLALADAELAPRSVAAVAGDAEHNNSEAVDVAQPVDQFVDEPSVTLEQRKDTPLVRLYNLLQNQSLHYRLDILYWQASQMSKLSWGQNVHAYIDERRILHLRYWRNLPSQVVLDKPGESWNPIQTSELRIFVAEDDEVSGTTGTVKTLLEKTDDRGQKAVDISLHIAWDVEGAVTAHLDGADVHIDHHALDAEALVRHVAKRHVSAAIDAFKARLDDSPLRNTMRFKKEVRSNDTDQHEILIIDIHDHYTVELSIDYLSGRLSLTPYADASSNADDDALSCPAMASAENLRYIREASEAIRLEPDKVTRILQKVRRQILMEDLERKAALADLPFTNRLPLNGADYDKLQGFPGSLLFIAMQQYPGYYLVVRAGEDTMHVTLILVFTQMENLITSMHVTPTLLSLDWTYILRACRGGPRLQDDGAKPEIGSAKRREALDEEDLAILHSYSAALIGYEKIQEQLVQYKVPFMHLTGFASRIAKADTVRGRNQSLSSKVSTILPSLCLDASTFLRAAIRSGFAKRKVLLRLKDWDDPLKARVEFVLRVSIRKGIVTNHLAVDMLDELSYDAGSGLLTFTLADLDNAFRRFLAAWRRLEMIFGLVKILCSFESKADERSATKVRLTGFDLISASFSYDEGLAAKIGWSPDDSQKHGGYFTLQFSSLGGESAEMQVNPHLIFASALQRALNTSDVGKATIWPGFLHLLRRTLPIAKLLMELEARRVHDMDMPAVEVRNAFWLRLTFKTRFMLDLRILRDRTYLFLDANATRDEGEKSNEVDEFSLAHPFSSVTTNDIIRRALRWSQLPGFATTVEELARKCKANADKSGVLRCLPFEHGLLFRGDADRAAGLLRELVDNIKHSLIHIEAP